MHWGGCADPVPKRASGKGGAAQSRSNALESVQTYRCRTLSEASFVSALRLGVHPLCSGLGCLSLAPLLADGEYRRGRRNQQQMDWLRYPASTVLQTSPSSGIPVLRIRMLN